MSALISMMKKKVTGSLISFYREYLRERGGRAGTCMVWGDAGRIWFETEDTAGSFMKEAKVDRLIRVACRDSVSLRLGPPQEDSDVFCMYLLPLPSVIKVIGLKRYKKLIDEWAGQTVFGNVPVIKYKVLI